MKYIILAAIAVVALYVQAVPAFQADMAEYRAEGKCISVLVAQGIERSDIVSGNGTCSIK